MFFYVDESGHTGVRLFDPEQPTLYYGVISSDVNLDIVAEGRLAKLRKKLSVERLHAGELGNGRLASIADDLVALHKQFKFVFDFYRVQKPDHAVISFFDQVFDFGMNKAVAWSHYWTPMRYVTLLKLASLFDEDIAKAAWAARIDTNKARAETGLVAVCQSLLSRVGDLVDERSRQIIGDALEWAANNPSEISYNVDDIDQLKQISPNIIGFQFVMHGIARRVKRRQRLASKIIVDRQSEFNKAQRTLAEFFAAAAGVKWVSGPGMPEVTFANMPQTPIRFVAGTESAGLELVDIYLWIFKRIIEDREVADELIPLFNAQVYRGETDEISLKAIANRWTKWYDNLTAMEDLTEEQVVSAKQIVELEEQRRQANMQALPSP